MKKALLLFTLFILTSVTFAFNVTLIVSEADADIYVDGSKVGNSPQVIKIPQRICVIVEIKKTGFISEKRMYCNSKKPHPEPPKKDIIDLKPDEAYNASSITDNANKDFSVEVNKKFNEDQAWKTVMMIVTNYIDDIQQNSKESGYLMTAWKVQNFPGKTVRTRVIVKLSNSNPLGYKIKIESQYSDEENTSAKADEKYKEWDRILKKYDNLISEFQSRLGNK